MAWNIANILIEAQKKSAGGGSGDYSDLSNKPQINNVTLSGNKSASDLGLAEAEDIPGLATTSAPGIVQPDGTSITINNGVISAVGGGGAFTVQTHSQTINVSDWTQIGDYYIYDVNIDTDIDLTNRSVFADAKSFLTGGGTGEIGLNGFAIRRYPTQNLDEIQIRLTRLSVAPDNGTIIIKLLII